MDEELRAIRTQEALTDTVYDSFYGVDDDTAQQDADDQHALLGSVL